MGMWKILIVVGLALAGCKRPNDDGAVLARLEGFSAAMCACTNKACADKINDDLTQWGQEMAKHADSTAKPSPELTKQIAPIMERYAMCLTKRMMGATQPAEAEPPPTQVPQ